MTNRRGGTGGAGVGWWRMIGRGKVWAVREGGRPPTEVGAKGLRPRSRLKTTGDGSRLVYRVGIASRSPVHLSGLRGRRPLARTCVPVPPHRLVNKSMI